MIPFDYINSTLVKLFVLYTNVSKNVLTSPDENEDVLRLWWDVLGFLSIS